MSGRLKLVGTLLIVLVLSLLVVVGVASAAGTFTDDDGNIHEGGIEAIAAAGITKGCNPPINDRYCPSSSLTRGQMAAFLRRALDLPPSSMDYFADDDDSVFEGDINALAEAGITKGCNPPAGDRYCPDGNITREQMAAFLRRAFNYPASPVDYFNDDDDSIFEADINAIAQAGVTKGCNPPDNDRYCPTKLVKRDQMASFFARALALPPPGTTPGVNEIDPEKTLLPDASDVTFQTLDNEGESHLTFDGKVDVGDVIVMGITPETPEGFLGKATRVSGDQVTTEPASLMDAIPVADFTAVVAVDPTHAMTSGSGDAALLGAQSLGFSCGGQSVTVDVDPEFESGSMIFEAKWGWTGLRKFEAGWRDLNISGDVSVTAAAGFGCTVSLPIFHQVLPPVELHVPPIPVPIVIVPTASIDLGFSAAASGGVIVGGEFNAGFGGGLIYEGGNWRTYTDPIYTASAFAPVLNAGGSLTVDVLAGLRGDIYGIGGPSVDFGPFVELAANTSIDPWWTIDGGISAGMDISTNRWLVDLSHELIRSRLLTWRLAEATTDPPGTGDPLTIITTALPDGTVSEPYEHQFLADGGEPPYAWAIVGGTLPEGTELLSSGMLTGTPTTEGPFPITVQVQDGATDEQQSDFVLTVAPDPPPNLGRMIDLGTLGGSIGDAQAINSAGQVTGVSDTLEGDSHAFFWDPATGVMQDLGTLGGNDSGTTAINNAGQVAGWSEVSPSTTHAFFWDPATGVMQDLGTLGGHSRSDGVAINDAGQVIGWSNASGGYRSSFLWDPATGVMQDLGTLGGGAWALAINATGQVAGYSDTSTGDMHAFFWDPATGVMQDLGTLGGGAGTVGRDINDAGQVTGSSSTPGGGGHAFVWDPNV